MAAVRDWTVACFRIAAAGVAAATRIRTRMYCPVSNDMPPAVAAQAAPAAG